MRKICVTAIKNLFEEEALVNKALDYAANIPHVMEFTRIRCLESTFALIRKGITNVLDYNDSHPDFMMTET
jgi:dynein heavy chain 1